MYRRDIIFEKTRIRKLAFMNHDRGNCRNQKEQKSHSSHVQCHHYTRVQKCEHYHLYPCHHGSKCAVSRPSSVHSSFFSIENQKTIEDKWWKEKTCTWCGGVISPGSICFGSDAVLKIECTPHKRDMDCFDVTMLPEMKKKREEKYNNHNNFFEYWYIVY